MSDIKRTITISGFDFEISTPYAEGHTCSEAEAKALNQTRSENIRNNMARKINAVKDDDGNLTEDQLAELTAAVAEYDAGYEFTLASVGGSASAMDPVEKLAFQIAREGVNNWLRSQDKKLADYRGKDADPELNAKYETAIATKAASEEVRKLAKKRLDEQNKANADMDSLGL